jgi:hypothetical protein
VARQSSKSVNDFAFSGSGTPQHSWPAAATQNHDGMPIFGRMIDKDFANIFHLCSQVTSSLPSTRHCTRVGEQAQRVPTYFLNCIFFLKFHCLNRNGSMLSEICSHGSMVRAVRLKSKRLPVLIQTACFCPSGTSAPTLFNSSEAEPSLSSRPGGLPPRAEICLLYTVLKWNARRVDSTSVLLPNSILTRPI